VEHHEELHRKRAHQNPNACKLRVIIFSYKWSNVLHALSLGSWRNFFPHLWSLYLFYCPTDAPYAVLLHRKRDEFFTFSLLFYEWHYFNWSRTLSVLFFSDVEKWHFYQLSLPWRGILRVWAQGNWNFSAFISVHSRLNFDSFLPASNYCRILDRKKTIQLLSATIFSPQNSPKASYIYRLIEI
jgi:hypothetical protein